MHLNKEKAVRLPLTPIRFLYRAVDLYGSKVGVVSGDYRFTYGQFGERCERHAASLQRSGVAPGDRVAYLTFNCHQLLEGYYGVPLASAILTPLNVRLSLPELIRVVAHSEPRLLFYGPEFTGVAQELRKSCASIRAAIALDSEYEALLSTGRVSRPSYDALDENAIAALFYTSGSTGTPKGVMLAHRTLYLHALGVAAMYNDRDAGVELLAMPLFHANGWGRPQTATMNGIKQVLVRRFVPGEILRLIETEQVTYLPLVPAMAHSLLNCPDLGRYDIATLRQITLGGAPSAPELIARLEAAFGCPALSGYGLTETSPAIATVHQKSTVRYSSEEDRFAHQAMGGWPLIGSEIRVVDENGAVVPQDSATVGEVIVRSDSVMDGYFKDPEATAAAIRDGWLHTGDLAVWDQEHYIQVVDREKEVIISGGENISSIELEQAIAAHPAVLECAVVAAPDEKWGETPVAIVRLNPGAVLTCEELIRFLEDRLARFKLPRCIEFVSDELPKTGSGKILKRQLREAFWTGKPTRVQGG